MNKFTFAIFISILLVTLIIRFYLVYHTRREYHDGDRVDISLLLLTDIDSNGNKTSITTNLPSSFPPERVTILLQPQDQLHYGQYLSLSSTIKSKVLITGRTALSIYYPKIIIRKTLFDRFFTILFSIRRHITDVYQLNLSDIDSSLLLGIVFGIKGQMPKSFMQDLQKTGLTHVIAASGMNVTMVAGFLIFLFTKYFRRQIGIICAVIGLMLYAIFSGLQASIVRATIMGICAFSAQALGKQYIGLYGLFLTAYLMLLYDPGFLFDVGFQLSLFATIGIVLINPLISRVSFITEDIATTLSAQLATVPIILTTFGQYSLLSILTNALVLWTIPMLMIIGSLGAVLGILIPGIGSYALYLAIPFLWYVEAIISFFANIATPLVLSNIRPTLIIGYYLIVIAIVMVGYGRQRAVSDRH